MIVAEQKPVEEIREMIKGCKRVMIAGCNTCVAICFAGGEKEAGILASVLRIAAKKVGEDQEIIDQTVQRQCEWEFLDEFKENMDKCDAIISLACGIGIQGLAERYSDKKVFPGVNTTFLGFPTLLFIFGFRKHNTGSLAHLGEKQMDNSFIILRKVTALNFDLEYNFL